MYKVFQAAALSAVLMVGGVSSASATTAPLVYTVFQQEAPVQTQRVQRVAAAPAQKEPARQQQEAVKRERDSTASRVAVRCIAAGGVAGVLTFLTTYSISLAAAAATGTCAVMGMEEAVASELEKSF